MIVDLLVVLVILEAAQLGVGIWAQLHRRTYKNASGPIR